MHAVLLGDSPSRSPSVRFPARRVLAVALGAHPLVACLEQRGMAVRHHAQPATLLMAPDLESAEIVVGAFGEREPEALPALGTLARLTGVPILLVGPDPAQHSWRQALALTASCYPATLPADLLADRVVHVLEQASGAGRPVRRGGPRQVTLRLWDSVEVDGVPIYLGVAERNFLFSLASAPGERMAKDEPVDVGGRTLPASACRRRLGQRLGPELAELLIPQERFEPYRLRSTIEVERLSHGPSTRHVPTILRIPGRGSVFASAVGRMESVATVA